MDPVSPILYPLVEPLLEVRLHFQHRFQRVCTSQDEDGILPPFGAESRGQFLNRAEIIHLFLVFPRELGTSGRNVDAVNDDIDVTALFFQLSEILFLLSRAVLETRRVPHYNIHVSPHLHLVARHVFRFCTQFVSDVGHTLSYESVDECRLPRSRSSRHQNLDPLLTTAFSNPFHYFIFILCLELQAVDGG